MCDVQRSSVCVCICMIQAIGTTTATHYGALSYVLFMVGSAVALRILYDNTPFGVYLFTSVYDVRVCTNIK